MRESETCLSPASPGAFNGGAVVPAADLSSPGFSLLRSALLCMQTQASEASSKTRQSQAQTTAVGGGGGGGWGTLISFCHRVQKNRDGMPPPLISTVTTGLMIKVLRQLRCRGRKSAKTSEK